MSAPDSPNPYVGPRSLRYGEHIYGRDREARQLLDLLIAERIVLLYSPSGAGKTSLIQAGLIPELEKEEFHVLPVIRVSRGAGEGVQPCNPYVLSALLSLEQGVPPEQAIPAEELTCMSLCEYLDRREATDGTDDGTFLVFDQFEEILTIDPMNHDAKVDFFAQVGEALRDLKRWALFAMREDHVAALDPYLRPVPTRLKSTFRLDLLGVESARIAVQRPAKAGGVEFTEEATTKLVDDLRQVAVQGPTGETVLQLGPYIEPVQLQVVCFRLWEKLPDNLDQISEEYVEATGTVDSALGDYYAERVAQIAVKSGVKERVLREWFDRRLITESGIRSQVMVGSENSREVNEVAIQALVDVHLIRGEERRGVTWLEMAHDRLVGPIRANNAAWRERNLSVLQHQSALWNNRGRPDALCLRGDARKEAQAWADEHENELTGAEREFLTVCQRNHDARKNKWALWAVGAMTVVLVGFSLLTRYAWQRADDARRERDIATARSIAARALQLTDDRLDVALLLATEAQRLSDQPNTRVSLLAAAYHNPRLTTYLNGSPAPVSATAFSADKARVATGDFAGNVLIWDVKTHRVVEKLERAVLDAVRTIAFSGDGRFMAVSSKDRTVVLRDLKTNEWKPLPTDHKHGGDVWSVAFSDDSLIMVSADSTGQILLWEIATGRITALPSALVDVRTVAFDSTGRLLVAGCGDGRILLWLRQGGEWVVVKREFSALHPDDPETDARRKAENVRLDSLRKNVRCLAISADGKYLAAGRRSGSVDLYHLAEPGDQLPVASFQRHDGAVSGLAFSPGTTGVPPDETRLITSSFDGTLRLWKIAAFEGTPRLWKESALEPVGEPFTGHVGRVLSVAFSADKQNVVSGGSDRRAILWDTWKHVAETGRTETLDASFSVAFSADGIHEANSYGNGTVILITRDPADWLSKNPATKTVIPKAEKPGRVPIVTFSGDSQRLATSAADGRVRVFDISKAGSESVPPIIGEIDVTAGDRAKRITAIGLSRDGAMIAASVSMEDVPAQVFAWKVATREPLFTEPLTSPKDDAMSAVEFSPDGSRIVTGGDAERTVIWLIGTGGKPQPLACPEEHTGSIRSITFDDEGKIFATTSGDNTVILWDAQTGSRLSPPLTGHHAPVIVAAFSPDGRVLATGSDDRSVILWDVETKQATGRLMGHTDSVRAIVFRKDGKRLYSGSWPYESREWKLDPAELQDICRERANRNLTDSEWTGYMLSGPFRLTWPKLPDPAAAEGAKGAR